MDVGSSSARRAYPSTHRLDGLGPETLNPPRSRRCLGNSGRGRTLSTDSIRRAWVWGHRGLGAWGVFGGTGRFLDGLP